MCQKRIIWTPSIRSSRVTRSFRQRRNIWFIINFLKIKNFKYFDTGGIDFMNNYNVAKFKKSIGGKYYENAGLNIY